LTEPDLQLLKSSIDKQAVIATLEGEELIAKIISVFDEESDPDIFYELVSTSHPHRYPRNEKVGGLLSPNKQNCFSETRQRSGV
jgi:hypothetical protein